jgi:hypothetical protein
MKTARAGEAAGFAHNQGVSRWILVLLIVMGLGAAERASGQATNRGFDDARIAIWTG